LLSTTEKKAINILKAFDNFPNANAGEKAKLKQAIEQIENKRFQSSSSPEKLNFSLKKLKYFSLL
jgi:Txe/YoeB family toxin of Txe-Axe toxin-antitoxin module